MARTSNSFLKLPSAKCRQCYWENDGKRHNVQFGFVNIGIGNFVVLYVDGESWIEYLDISDSAVNVNCEFSMFVNAGEGEMMSMKAPSMVSTEEEFDKLIERGLNKAVKSVLNKFESDVMLFQTDAAKVFTPKGVFDVSFCNTSLYLLS